MKLTSFTVLRSAAKRWVSVTLVCLLAIAFVWQGAFVASSEAMPYPEANLIAAMDMGNQVQDKASKDAGRAKGFIQDTKDAVKKTANKNADRVEQATDGKGNFIERKANRDVGRIEQRAEQDAARTQKAVDGTKNVIERTVDGIKDAFN